jgi:signal transduction histidine kinase
MSGTFLLDWAVMAASSFNTILLLWLGLTVLLNAERRSLGIWLAGGGMLTGAGFFLSHSAILGSGLDLFSPAANFWWRVGWLMIVISPFAWYLVMLWYSGFWEGKQSAIYRRHRLPVGLLAVLGVGMAGLVFSSYSLPSLGQAILLNLEMPLMIWLYPLYNLSCIGLALHALLHPGPTSRMMGDLARQRARPWLAAASLMLLLVALLVGSVIGWLALSASPTSYDPVSVLQLARRLAGADLVISILIAAAITLTGQAIASYEIFTGRTLPSRGLLRYWQRALILATGYSLLISLSLTLNLPPIYSLLLSAVLLVLFYALLSWRSYIERQRLIASLRPFVSGQLRYTQLLDANATAGEMDLQSPFNALCEHVLGTRRAVLLPLGAMAPLAGKPLTYPASESPPHIPHLPELIKQLNPQELCIPVQASDFAGAHWAASLWNERGLGGVLLLDEKLDGGLYSQEEIEIARSACERLLDLQATAELARRLLALQRQRLAESQVVDRRARRILHDDILPQLHAAMLQLNSDANPGAQESVSTLGEVHQQISNLLRDIIPAAPELGRLGLVGTLRKLVDGEFQGAFDTVAWRSAPEAEQKADHLPAIQVEVLFHAAREAIRNAARHARLPGSSRPLALEVSLQWKDGLEILVKDNGAGMPSNGEPGSGHGLALHSAMLAVIGGSLSVENVADSSTCLRIFLPEV